LLEYHDSEAIKAASQGEAIPVKIVDHTEYTSDHDISKGVIEDRFEEGLGIDLDLDFVDTTPYDPREFFSEVDYVDEYEEIVPEDETGKDGVKVVFTNHDLLGGTEHGLSGVEGYGNFSFIEPEEVTGKTENEIARQIGYTFGLDDVNHWYKGNYDIMGNSLPRNELAKWAVLGFTSESQEFWKNAQQEYI
jgi:hypothetical protein